MAKRQPFMGIGLVGAEEINKTLKKLDTKLERKTARRAVNKGLTLAAREIRKRAPVGATRRLKKAIGGKVKKQPLKMGGGYTAKVGANVGKKGRRKAYHTHLIVLGTKPRKRKRIGGKFSNYEHSPTSTGRVKENDFIREGFEAAKGKVIAKIATELKKDLAKIK